MSTPTQEQHDRLKRAADSLARAAEAVADPAGWDDTAATLAELRRAVQAYQDARAEQ
ncbi:MAG: hypothetical protein GY772_27100 [bacterium]|nr:hypothetical protein [bacterium]